MSGKLGLYVHVPFCVSKCAYCDFYSLTHSEELMQTYAEQIICEINRWGGMLKHPPADTLYFGGGTPSLLNEGQIKAIIDSCKDVFSLKEAEITLECNPADRGEEYFKAVALAGVNRISLGLQSGVENELKALSRRHTALDVKNTVDAARNAGINNISLDIMLGIPDQTKESLAQTVDFALSCNPQHISAYLLSLEEGTPLYNNRELFNIPTSDDAGELYLYACDLLRKGGFERYEISNFARAGKISRHNTKYWVGDDYLGFGPAAHSFVNGKRFYYECNLADYLKNPTEMQDGCGGDMEERILLGLRLAKGISLKEYTNEFGIDKNKINRITKKAELFCKNGLVSFDGDVIALTDKGALLSNSVIAELLNCL